LAIPAAERQPIFLIALILGLEDADIPSWTMLDLIDSRWPVWEEVRRYHAASGSVCISSRCRTSKDHFVQETSDTYP
jgi:hypothetical protein